MMTPQNQMMFDVKRISAELQTQLPAMEWQIDYGVDHISMTCPNHKNPRFPLIITIHETQGIFLDLSQCGGILECHSDVPEVVKYVKDVLDDKIIVAIAYPDEEKFEKQVLYSMMRSFHMEEEDDSLDFANFVSNVSKPRAFLNRLNIFAFHGFIEISNWSGSHYHKIYRK